MVGSGFAGVHDNVVQLDIVDFPNIDVVSKSIPFKDSTFDNIFCENVIEHVPNPFKLVEDLIRVLKPNGYLGINGTNMHFTHGFPSHYFNPTEFGMRHLLDNYFSKGDYHFIDEAHSLLTIFNYFFNSLPVKEKQYIGEITINDFLNGLKFKDKNLLRSLSKMHPITKKSISTGIYFLGQKKKKS